jgi:CelD/BcsL family acetyltransferase involved in cellulose biosynthesis
MSLFARKAEDKTTTASSLGLATGALARFEVHETAWAALRAWREIESFSTGSSYQTRGFALPWLEFVAPTLPASPLIIVGYDAENRPAILLPLAVQHRGPLKLAMFAGGKHSNLNLPLTRPGFNLSPPEARALLVAAGRAAKLQPDMILLHNQPTIWNSKPNPFAALDPSPSPSFAYGATIGADADAFLKRIDSAATRKKLKSKATKLAALGPLHFERAEGPERARTVLSVFIDQKTLRFTQKHRDPGVGGVAMRAFLDAIATGRGGGALALDLYALSVGDRIVATYGGLPRGRAWHGMFNSFNPAPEIARSSPGELLLRHVIRDLSSRGVERFDLGVGESRYKSAICDETIELADVVVPVTLAGRLGAPLESARLATKRWVKQTPWALSFVEQMRAGPV